MTAETTSQNESIGGEEPAPIPASRWRRTAYRVMRLCVFGYGAMLIALVVMETRLVYPGAYMGGRAPDRFQQVSQPGTLQVESFEYKTQDDTQLLGRMVRNPNADCVVLFFHGNASRAAWMDHWALRLARHLSANVVLAEYRGYGNDVCSPCEDTVIADSLAAHDAVKDQFQVLDSDIILYGRSLGGGCAAAVAAQRGAALLVLERTFDRMVDVAAAKYTIFPVGLLMRNRYDSVAHLVDYTGPVVQVHGRNDRLIPVAHAETLYASIGSQDKTFIALDELGHNDFLPDEVLRAIARQLEETAGAAHSGR